MAENVSIYIHIPFCRTRCFYCDFNTFAGKERHIPDYVNALQNEIMRQRSYEKGSAKSIYFGGGTPSRLAIEDVALILNTIHKTFSITSDAEITFECNPCDVTVDYAKGLAKLGFNRISLGMQSAVPDELKRMGRRHSPEQTERAVHLLKNAGFRNISLDLIYGYPGQSIESWKNSLFSALKMGIQHVSLYALSVEEGSALRRQLEDGKLTLPDDELTVAMYETAAEILSMEGFLHYEISNWSVDEDHESRHNRQYWFVGPYYGFGAGAHGWIGHNRIRNVSKIEDYIRAVSYSEERFPAAEEIIPQDRHIEMQDVMMLGLRMLQEGITDSRFCERFGEDMRIIFRRELHHLEHKGLVFWTPDGRLLLSPDKVMVANQAFIEFVD